MPPEVASDILDELRTLLAGSERASVLVVGSAELRPRLAELVWAEFPELPVLAHDELPETQP